MKILKNLFLISAMIIGLASCDDNDALVEKKVIDDNGEEVVQDYDALIYISEDQLDNHKEANVEVESEKEVEVKISFKSEETPLRRLYITENIAGAGATPYVLTIEHDSKADGSIDLETKYKKGFDFVFKMKAPELGEGVENGTVEYKFWATTKRGDFRDSDKNKMLEIGTITFTYGTKENTAKVKEYLTTIKLDAPLADLSSETFISLFDGKTYKISEGVEFAAFWDFGFFYGTTNKTCLYSTHSYPFSIFKDTKIKPIIEQINADIITGDINKTFFKISEHNSEFFDTITVENLEDIDVDNITGNMIKNLQVNDIIEFKDAYSKAGFIKVMEINPSAGSKGYIKINIKMQS